MKTLKLIGIVTVLFIATSLQAQVSINVNVGSPPAWGPSGYNDVHYYYLPDVEAYYDVNASMFIYLSGGNWIHRTYLPGRYRNYDLYGGYKVVMNDYRGNRPYDHFREHRGKYKRGYHGNKQNTIGQRPGKGNNKGGGHSDGRSFKNDNHNNGRNPGQIHNNNIRNERGGKDGNGGRVGKGGNEGRGGKGGNEGRGGKK